MVFRILAGLPPYGPLAMPFPTEWGRLGREGFVIEFTDSAGDRWTANFRPGLGGLNGVGPHPDGRHVLVFAGGDAWSVDPDQREAVLVGNAIDAQWVVPGGLVLSRQGLAFLRLAASGTLWHTRRLSWDGFQNVLIHGETLTADAWSPLDDSWVPCWVDLASGRSHGGSYFEQDVERWEQLAPRAPG
jgi:hypothetical protein